MATLQCAEAWLGLNLVAGSGCILTPAQVQAQQGQLLGATLELLVHPSSSEGVVEAAVQLLLLVYGPDNFSADEQADLAATAALVRALLGTRGRLAGAPSDTLPAGVAKLAAAVAERAPEFCCGQMAEVRAGLAGRAGVGVQQGQRGWRGGAASLTAAKPLVPAHRRWRCRSWCWRCCGGRALTWPPTPLITSSWPTRVGGGWELGGGGG